MQMDIKFELKPKQRPKLVEGIATVLHTGKGRDAPHPRQRGRGNSQHPKGLVRTGALENLIKLVENKGGLMARAFQAEKD